MQTMYEPKEILPYSLHDAKVRKATLTESTLELEFQDTIRKLAEPYPYVEGKLLIEGIQPKSCAFCIMSQNGKFGSFKGKKISIDQFIKKLHNHYFEIIEEYHNSNQITFIGFWDHRTKKLSREAILNISYFSGRQVYVTNESAITQTQHQG